MDFRKGEIIAIDKPYRMSSFGALAHVRYLLSKKLGFKVKIGHAGTLDPLATGVLVLCTGKCTKQIEQLQTHTKEYTATLQLGATTASYDKEHSVNHTYPTKHITRQLVEETLKQFVGEIQQVPPTYSAVKVNGDRSYALRRAGEEVQLKPKTVRVDEIELTDYNDEEKTASIRVVCGKGTYIRSLARDIGRALDSGVILTAAEMGESYYRRFHTLELQERDLYATDPETFLVEGITNILHRLPELPPAVLTFTACVHHFLGVNLPYVYRTLRHRFPSVQFAECIMDPIRQTKSMPPETRERLEIARLLKKSPLPPEDVTAAPSDREQSDRLRNHDRSDAAAKRARKDSVKESSVESGGPSLPPPSHKPLPACINLLGNNLPLSPESDIAQILRFHDGVQLALGHFRKRPLGNFRLPRQFPRLLPRGQILIKFHRNLLIAASRR